MNHVDSSRRRSAADRGSWRRKRLLAAATDARRRLEPPTGRAWINGREVGGPDPRYRHLAALHG